MIQGKEENGICQVREEIEQNCPIPSRFSFLGDDRQSVSTLLDTSVQTSEGCGEIDTDLGKITDRKRAAQALGGRIEIFDKRRGERMRFCMQDLRKRRCPSCGKDRGFSGARLCYDKLCPVCSRQRSARLVNTLGSGLKTFQEEKGCYSYFLTLTFIDSERLQEYKYLTGCVKRLFDRKLWKRYGLIGGFRSFETKIGKRSGKWHSHFHIVVFTERPIELIETGEHTGEFQNVVNQEISEQWEAITGGSFIVKGKSFDGNYSEAIKYLTKGAGTLNDEQLKELATWSKGKRTYSLFGKLYNNKELKKLIEEEKEEEEETPCECGCCQVEETTFRFDDRLNNYIVDRVEVRPIKTKAISESPPV